MIFNPAKLKHNTEEEFYSRLKRACREGVENTDKFAVFLKANIDAGVLNKKIMCSGDEALEEKEWDSLVREVVSVASAIETVKQAEEQKEVAVDQLKLRQRDVEIRVNLEKEPAVEKELGLENAVKGGE
jgi:K+ transporter